ncbi:enoyl-CoA hydratase/isomerase family protein [Zeaxanthinibacter sp. PT1]|uniref:enoyl-CoA hydratase/isomerase family protein n=1 Tax=Zeaxanthinibacter TaxID=561554 RepID=UPI00234B73BB|nr:enoyl-CoA hydratase/isomerase family protein [Zeaxanthinibacter sp. PT1]MDC6350833.1 enoyl-CoA hydratase/isomerase family protein [Zeaxanthinibacter sp. PT1]
MSTNRENGSLYTNVNNKVARVEFGHPASNSFVSELLARLGAEIIKLSGRADVSLIILQSEGERAFCAGASFDELVAIDNLEEGKEFFSGFARVLNAMRICKKPIIGRVQGKAVGGGVGLISGCDYVFATEAASVRLSEITIGIAPLVIAPAVERKIGKGGLAELSLSPTEWKNAYWAKEKSLFTKVFESIPDMDKELDHFSQQLAGYNPEALYALKKIFWEGTEHWGELLSERAEESGRLALSPETKKALEKFKNKK